ncbi:nickel pincer cofactor biosynthesis protein LarC [Chloroflexota bacterium]
MSAGTKRIMVIDALGAGVSGDMMAGALLDLGASTTRVIEAIQTSADYLKGCKSLKVEVVDVTKKGIHAKKLNIEADEDLSQRTRGELKEAAVNLLGSLAISDQAKQFLLDCIDTLITAEAKVHGETKDAGHLHELASVDTLADLVASAVALDDLGLFTSTRIYSTAVTVGGGLLQFSHGKTSCPAPATLEILRSKGALMAGGGVEAELTTPTGATIITNLAHGFLNYYPLMKPVAVGYGAGTRDFDEMPNVLRIALGEPGDSRLLSDQVYVIETNLDDLSGEAVGHAADRLLQEGARDVNIIPFLAKKNRPGQIIKVIADSTSLEHLSRVLIDETGTLGVRFYPCERRILARESTSIDLLVGNTREVIPIKVARDTQGEILQIKPEYEEVKRLADRTGIPLRNIIDMVKKRAREVLLAGESHDHYG